MIDNYRDCSCAVWRQNCALLFWRNQPQSNLPGVLPCAYFSFPGIATLSFLHHQHHHQRSQLPTPDSQLYHSQSQFRPDARKNGHQERPAPRRPRYFSSLHHTVERLLTQAAHSHPLRRSRSQSRRECVSSRPSIVLNPLLT